MNMEIPNFNQKEVAFEKQRQNMVRKLAGLIHEEWRSKRRKEDGSYEPRIKKTQDRAWSEQNGEIETDIANTDFENLPLDWQEENLLSAKAAIEKIEDALNIIHDKWLDRNDEFAEPQQKNQFSRLPDQEKAKDIAVLEKAVEIMRRELK